MCFVSSADNRPVVGVIIVNLANLRVGQNYIESLTKSFLHQMIQIMAFSPSLLRYFPNGENIIQEVVVETEGGQKKVKKYYGVNTITEARRHFACPIIDGIYLESDDNQEFQLLLEKKFFGNELMTASGNEFSVFSVLSLAILEDSTWYLTDRLQAEHLPWGKDKGCDFYSYKGCLQTIEFCQKE